MTTEIYTIYETLLAHYGDPEWWPADTPYEVIVGAILTQNTAWTNVEKALANFDGTPTPEHIAQLPLEELADIIRPAGFFNQKAQYLKAVTAWFARYDYSVTTVQAEPLNKLRSELLATRGVGPETADSILLYAFGFPTFVIDAYTMRLASRIPLAMGKGYALAKARFEDSLPRTTDIYNRFHALIVVHAKAHCRTKPVCVGCPLEERCQKVGTPTTPTTPATPTTPQEI